MDQLIAKAESLGLVVPALYTRFVRDAGLFAEIANRARSQWSQAFYPTISPRLYKCPSLVNGGLGGYFIQIGSINKYENCGRCYLYLPKDSTREYCILSSLRDRAFDPTTGHAKTLPKVSQEDIDAAREDGLDLASVDSNEIWLLETDFEAFLARLYFNDEIRRLNRLRDIEKVSKRLRDYVMDTHRKIPAID